MLSDAGLSDHWSEKHLRAAKNGFDMVAAQSFATGGWGPDGMLRATGGADVYDSLTKTHSGFETPCGSYAHFKLTRYLLRVTRNSRYGDSMERVRLRGFARVQRQWKDGDRVEVELPMKARLETVDLQHADTVALLVGPVVLFAITDIEPKVTRAQLLAAKKTGEQSWQVETAGGLMKMLPFTAIGEEQYSTYVRVS